jgi:hypothetical protein
MKKLEGGFCATLFTVFVMDATVFSPVAFFWNGGLIGRRPSLLLSRGN